jgi:hypothetical protein
MVRSKLLRQISHSETSPPGQGSGISLAGDDPEQIVVVPGGLPAPAAKAGLTAAVAGEQGESDFAQEGEVAGGGVIAHPAVILMSRGFDPARHPAKPLVNYQSNRQFSGWNLPPLVKRAIGAHRSR